MKWLLKVWPSTSHTMLAPHSPCPPLLGDQRGLPGPMGGQSHRQKESGAQDASWRSVHKTRTQNTGVGLLNEEETNPYYVKEVRFGGSLLWQPGSLHKTDLNCPFNDL